MRRRLAFAASTLLLAASAAHAQAPAAAPARRLPVFTEVTATSGITWTRSFGDHDLSNIVEGTGSGACVFDYDGDGRLDVYFPQGRWEKTVSDNRGRDLIGQLSNAAILAILPLGYTAFAILFAVSGVTRFFTAAQADVSPTWSSSTIAYRTKDLQDP